MRDEYETQSGRDLVHGSAWIENKETATHVINKTYGKARRKTRRNSTKENSRGTTCFGAGYCPHPACPGCLRPNIKIRKSSITPSSFRLFFSQASTLPLRVSIRSKAFNRRWCFNQYPHLRRIRWRTRVQVFPSEPSEVAQPWVEPSCQLDVVMGLGGCVQKPFKAGGRMHVMSWSF